MPHNVGFILLGWCLSVFLWMPSIVFAQEAAATPAGSTQEKTCSCWCSTDQGAESIGDKTMAECKSACVLKKSSYLICASDPAAWPVNDPQCFRQAECTDALATGGYNGDWDVRANPNCPSDLRYCFQKSGSAEIRLSVPIGNMKTVKDFETYVSVGFQWLLGSAIVITIVWIMIGGAQYAFGAVTQEQISKAKHRIKNGAIGLILLMTSILLIQTVNPQLLNMNIPRFPLIKRIVTPGGTSCEDYVSKKYEVSSEQKRCGVQSDVIKDANGNAVPVGTTCMWTSCPNDMDRCLVFPGGARCTSCTQLVDGDQGLIGTKSTASACAQFQYETEVYEGKPFYRYCGWTKDNELNGGLELKIQRTGSCAYYSIDCRNINSCDDYDTQVEPENVYGSQPLEDVIYEESELCGLAGCGNFGLQTVCAVNPCQIEGGCMYDRKALFKYDCISAK